MVPEDAIAEKAFQLDFAEKVAGAFQAADSAKGHRRRLAATN